MADNKTKPTDASVEAYIGRELVVYLVTGGEEQRSLLSKLGKHRMGKVCLYFKQLADLDKSVLKQLVVGSIAEARRRHG